MNNLKTKDMVLIAMFAALTAIGAFLKIPTPMVPYTLQFLFCAYAGILLGSRNGLYSQAVYVGMGLVGFPVFTAGGGPAYVLQPTFGYLLGFIVCAYVIGKLTEKQASPTRVKMIGAVLAGLFWLYFIGLIYLYVVLKLIGTGASVYRVLALGFTPYIIPDLVMSVVIGVSAVYILPNLRKAGLINGPGEASGNTNS